MKYSWAIKGFSDFVAQFSRFHPTNREQVAERFEQAIPNTVMTFSSAARVVRHRHFRNGEAFELNQGRKESMRTVEELDLRNAFALEHTIGAARVRDVLAGQFVAHPVGNARRNNSKPTVSFAARFNPRAADAIGAAQRYHHRRQIFGIVL